MSPKRPRGLQELQNQEQNGGSGPSANRNAGLELDDERAKPNRDYQQHLMNMNAHKHAEDVQEMLTHQDGVSGGPAMQRLKSSTHLNNINLLKNQTLKSQGPQNVLGSISQANLGPTQKPKSSIT